MLDHILKHLAYLVSCDTQNPPREITGGDDIFVYCKSVLEQNGCVVQIHDLGNGCVNLLAVRGTTDLLFHCHLDTVPADRGWAGDPFQLVVNNGNAVGLGACDIKGAAACLLSVAERSDEPIALLLTSDEEAGESVCIDHFLANRHPYTWVIECEPTNGEAVIKHRGIETYELEFIGTATHSSSPCADNDNAIHHATEWSSRALRHMRESIYNDLRFNIGVIAGGTKTNIAASSAKVRFGMRPHAMSPMPQILDDLMGLAIQPGRVSLTRCFKAPALDGGLEAKAFVQRLELDHAQSVCFWTEASLFANAGIPAIVLGPGDIAQAHTSGEFVSVSSLLITAERYAKIVSQVARYSHGLCANEDGVSI